MKILNARDTTHWAYRQTQNFIDKFSEACIYAQEKHGFDAVTLMAQFALEIGWKGETIKLNTQDDLLGEWVDSKNLGNIKAFKSWTGKKGYKNVREYEDGGYVNLIQPFRIYDNYKDSINDYIDVIKRNFTKAYNERKDSDMYLYQLQEGRRKYATDPDYENKVKRVRQQNFIYEVENETA